MVGTVLDTVIGLSFVFALTALMVTACVEGVAAATKKRAKWLLRGIQQLFAEEISARTSVTAERALYDKAREAPMPRAIPKATSPAAADEVRDWVLEITGHPLVQSLRQRKVDDRSATRFPSEIPASTFARAFLDRLLGDQERTSENLLEALARPDVPLDVQEALKAIIRSLPADDTAAIQKGIEDWYNAQMKAVSEAYRRWTKRWAIPIGIVAAGILNVSTISIAHALYVDEPLRDATVAAATSGALCEGTGDDAEASAASTRTCVTAELEKLDDKGMPIGWPAQGPDGFWWAVLIAFGWVLTGLAASFGAPFWFDALKRLSGVRNTLEGT
jgi:hypothetical protein